MKNPCNFEAPLLIIGMHRTGTSLLSRVLNDAGIYMGAIRDHNGESFPILGVNQELLPDWTQPQRVTTGIGHAKRAILAAHYQLPNEARWRLWPFRNHCWGWKDPRTTFTLKAWMQLFPDLRVVHMRRQPEAVIKSLLARSGKPGEATFGLSQDAAFALHMQYENEALTYGEWGADRYLEVHYEKLVARDPEQISALNKFCGVDVTEALSRYLRAST
jgi:hypothetical protein